MTGEGFCVVEVTDIHGRLDDEDIARGLEEAPIIYVLSCTAGQHSMHIETLTTWDQEVRGLIVKQTKTRVGVFRVVEQSELHSDLLTRTCGDRGHFPPVVLQGTPPSEGLPHQPIDNWREMLTGPEDYCTPKNEDILDLPSPRDTDVTTQEIH
jgi:hypothetical protein